MPATREHDPLTCPYCNSEARLMDAAVVYGKPGFGRIWVCMGWPFCKAYVGVHKDTEKPLGSLANSELRELRKRVHSLIDPLWREGVMERAAMYRALATIFEMAEFHVAELREHQARAVLSRSATLASEVIALVDATESRARETMVANPPSEDLVRALRYLYCGMHRQLKTSLSYTSYRGHRATFLAGVEAGLLERVTVDNNKVLYRMTHACKRLLQEEPVF